MEDSLFTEKCKRNPDRSENTKKTHETEAGAFAVAGSPPEGKPSPGEVHCRHTLLLPRGTAWGQAESTAESPSRNRSLVPATIPGFSSSCDPTGSAARLSACSSVNVPDARRAWGLTVPLGSLGKHRQPPATALLAEVPTATRAACGPRQGTFLLQTRWPGAADDRAAGVRAGEEPVPRRAGLATQQGPRHPGPQG